MANLASIACFAAFHPACLRINWCHFCSLSSTSSSMITLPRSFPKTCLQQASKCFSTNLKYCLLIPPGKGLLNPWILTVRKSQQDCMVKSAIIELMIHVAPDSLWREAEPCLMPVMSAQLDLILWAYTTHHYRCESDVVWGNGGEAVHLTKAVMPRLVFSFDMLHVDCVWAKQ